MLVQANRRIVYVHQSLAGPAISIYTGKEYCRADSRYASRDPFTICMEAVTAFAEGPLCFVIMYGMLKQKPWRFTLQFAVSLGQLYGDVLYFATSWYDGALRPHTTTATLLMALESPCMLHYLHCIAHAD